MDDKMPVTSQAFVGLDLSLTASGFAVKQGTHIEMRTIKTNPKTAVNDLARLEYIRDEILKLIPPGVAMVCVEDYFMPHMAHQIGAAIGLVGLGMTVRIAMYDRGIPFYVVADSQLKKFVTGKGAGQKSMILREAYKRWGIEAKDDNQADACVLAYIAEALAGQAEELTAFQKETVDKILAERPRYNIPTQE